MLNFGLVHTLGVGEWVCVWGGGRMCVVREELRIFLSLCRMRILICEVEKWKRACEKAMKKRLRCLYEFKYE